MNILKGAEIYYLVNKYLLKWKFNLQWPQHVKIVKLKNEDINWYFIGGKLFLHEGVPKFYNCCSSFYVIIWMIICILDYDYSDNFSGMVKNYS